MARSPNILEVLVSSGVFAKRHAAAAGAKCRDRVLAKIKTAKVGLFICISGVNDSSAIRGRGEAGHLINPETPTRSS